MKTKLYLPIISLLAMSVFAFISCDDSDSDTTKPVIELHEPEEGQELKIGGENGVHFEMELSDEVMLKSYMIEINRSYDISGKKTAHIHHHDIVIPVNATPGDYHLMVYCTDAAGNEAYIARNIVLSTTAEEDDHHHDE